MLIGTSDLTFTNTQKVEVEAEIENDLLNSSFIQNEGYFQPETPDHFTDWTGTQLKIQNQEIDLFNRNYSISGEGSAGGQGNVYTFYEKYSRIQKDFINVGDLEGGRLENWMLQYGEFFGLEDMLLIHKNQSFFKANSLETAIGNFFIKPNEMKEIGDLYYLSISGFEETRINSGSVVIEGGTNAHFGSYGEMTIYSAGDLEISSGFFNLASSSSIIFDAPNMKLTAPSGVDFTGSPINLGTGLVQRKSKQIITSGNDTSYDFRNIESNATTEASPFDNSGKTIPMFNGLRVPQGAFNLYIGVRTLNGNMRVMGGNGYGDGTNLVYRPIWASSFDVVSSYNLKTNIIEYQEDALGIVDSTKIYSYNYKSDIEAGADVTDTKKIGLIVEYSPELQAEGKKSIDVYKMNSVLWKATQQLNQKIKGLEMSLEMLMVQLEEKGVIE